MEEIQLPTGLGPVLAEPEEPIVGVAPQARPATPREWLRANLFSTKTNGVVTVLTAALIGYLGFRLLRWVFVTSDFAVVKANFRVYMIGRFPLEEAWRVWVTVYLVASLAGLSWGVSGKRLRRTLPAFTLRAFVVLLLIAPLVYLLDGVRIWVLVAAIPAAYAVGLAVGRVGGRRLRRVVLTGWILVFPAIVVILQISGGVPPRFWGGFWLVNITVATASIVLSFPLGLLLALGRRSSLPAIRVFCVGFIELIRGVPLFTLLLVSLNLLTLMLPPGTEFALLVRATIMMTFFSSAYVAEIVRGGLQGVPEGQYEAARAVGLSTTRTMAFVILPQALRSTIPAMISHFISLFKDTSLLTAIAILEMLRAARQSASQIQFIGHGKEALLAAGIIFWIVAFSMSRWSQRLERRVGLGER